MPRKYEGEFGDAPFDEGRPVIAASKPPEPIRLDIDPDDVPHPHVEGKEESVETVYFDWDGTWFRWQYFQEFIIVMVRLGLLPSIVLEIARRSLEGYLNREAPFSEWVMQQVRAYQDEARLEGIRVSDVRLAAKILYEEKGKRVHVFSRELCAAAKDIGMRRAIITGTMTEAIEVVAQAEGIHAYIGTDHPKDATGTRYTGAPPKEWVLNKAEAMHVLAQRHHLGISNGVAIGDSLTDAKMFELVQWPICFNPAQGLFDLARKMRWPVVMEKKDACLILRANERGNMQEVSVLEILPEELGEGVARRLSHLGYLRS